MTNVFDHYLAHDHYLGPIQVHFSSTTTATARTTTSLIYYAICLEARLYDYLASSEVRNESSSKLVTVTLSS
jgi:hypothetical protein